MLYTDGAHLTADSLDELYGYANKIGLQPEWIDFMGKNLHPHFDICGRVKQRVLADENVQKVTRKEIVQLCKQNFRLPETDDDWQATNVQGDSSPDSQLPSESDYERMLNNIFKKAGISRSE